MAGTYLRMSAYSRRRLFDKFHDRVGACSKGRKFNDLGQL